MDNIDDFIKQKDLAIIQFLWMSRMEYEDFKNEVEEGDLLSEETDLEATTRWRESNTSFEVICNNYIEAGCEISQIMPNRIIRVGEFPKKNENGKLESRYALCYNGKHQILESRTNSAVLHALFNLDEHFFKKVSLGYLTYQDREDEIDWGS